MQSTDICHIFAMRWSDKQINLCDLGWKKQVDNAKSKNSSFINFTSSVVHHYPTTDVIWVWEPCEACEPTNPKNKISSIMNLQFWSIYEHAIIAEGNN